MADYFIVDPADDIVKDLIAASPAWVPPADHPYEGFTKILRSNHPEADIGWQIKDGVATYLGPAPPTPPTDEEVYDSVSTAFLADPDNVNRAVLKLVIKRLNNMSNAIQAATDLASLKAAFPQAVGSTDLNGPDPDNSAIKTAIETEMGN